MAVPSPVTVHKEQPVNPMMESVCVPLDSVDQGVQRVVLKDIMEKAVALYVNVMKKVQHLVALSMDTVTAALAIEDTVVDNCVCQEHMELTVSLTASVSISQTVIL